MERIGQTRINKYGSKMTIIEYNGCMDIIVEFENGYQTKSQYSHFKNEDIVSLYDKTIYGNAYIGEGKYKVSKDRKKTIQYNFWYKMLQRCYDEEYRKKNPTYKGITCCEEWLNFQTFAQWFDKNYYECNDGYLMDLDKDILCKGNKVYSPDTCIFVPHRINCLFTKCDKARGDYPIGVTYYKDSYRARCSTLDKRVSLGMHKTPEEAFNKGYKPFKEDYIKQVANYYKSQIPQELYDAMYRYVVEIDD